MESCALMDSGTPQSRSAAAAGHSQQPDAFAVTLHLVFNTHLIPITKRRYTFDRVGRMVLSGAAMATPNGLPLLPLDVRVKQCTFVPVRSLWCRGNAANRD